MDRKELNIEIQRFINRCDELNKPIQEYCLNEVYAGDSTTSYFFDLKSDWIKEEECFDAISFFTDVMFDVMSREARERLFSIRVFTKDDELHCDTGEIVRVTHPVS